MYKKSIHLRITRLVTLACFFHFSGLNNGFTYLLNAQAAAGGPQMTGFAPVFLSKCVSAFNPVVWQKAASVSSIFGFFSRSGKVIEYASQNALQNLLLESTLFHVILDQSAKGAKTLTVRNAPASRAQLPVLSEVNSRGAKPDAFGCGSSSLGRGLGNDYINTDRSESWIVPQKLQFMGRQKEYGPGKYFSTYTPGSLALATGLHAVLILTGTAKSNMDLPVHFFTLNRLMDSQLNSGEDGPASGIISGAAQRSAL